MKKNNYLLFLILFFFPTIFWSCDYTPILQKDIYEAQTYMSKGEYRKASLVYDDVLKKTFKRSIKRKILLQQGNLNLIFLKDAKKAVEYYNQLYDGEQDPYWQVIALEKLADTNFHYLKDYYKAFQYYQILYHFTPSLEKFDYYQYQTAISLLNLSMYDDAAKYFLEISKNKNHQYNIIAIYYLGLISFYKKQWSNAIDQLKKFVALSTDHSMVVQAKFIIANSYETEEKYKEAYNIYFSLLDQYPNTDVVKSRLRSLYARRQDRKR